MTTIKLLIPGPRYQKNQTLTVELVLFDVDNTLTGNNNPGLPSEYFIDTAHKAKQTVVIGLATARPLSKAKHIIEACGMNGLSILSNGAQIYDAKTSTMVRELPLSEEVSLQICRTLQERNLNHWVQDDGVDHLWTRKKASNTDNLGDYAVAKDIWQSPENADVSLISEYRPKKALAIVANKVKSEDVDSVLGIADNFGGSVISMIAHEFSESDGTKTYEIFFLDKHANKHDALLALSEMTGVAREHIMAVGDGPNDTVIVENAGIGVAMGNAVDKTKAVATFIAPSIDDDGAAVALNELVLQ